MKSKTKKCNKCEIEKPLEEFHKRKASKDGHRSQCKLCRRISVKEGPKSKRCSKCLVLKPLVEFHKHKNSKHGRKNECRQCKHERLRRVFKVCEKISVKEGFKRCSNCEVERPLTEFHKCRNNKDGLHYRCKQCRKEYRSFEERKKQAAKVKVKGTYKLKEERNI